MMLVALELRAVGTNNNHLRAEPVQCAYAVCCRSFSRFDNGEIEQRMSSWSCRSDVLPIDSNRSNIGGMENLVPFVSVSESTTSQGSSGLITTFLACVV